MNDILFASLDLPLLDKQKAADDILAVDDSYTFWNSYRKLKMLPLMTRQGHGGSTGTVNQRDGEFQWVSYAPASLTKWMDEVVFPWIGGKTRVMALITEPGFVTKEHIDCDEHQIGTLQNKLRIVLQGETDSLYWVTDKGKVFAPKTDGLFIMDGGWPHGMINTAPVKKVTIAVGAPFNGSDEYGPEVKILQNRRDFNLPEDLTRLLRTEEEKY